jgi:hypothetical protein
MHPTAGVNDGAHATTVGATPATAFFIQSLLLVLIVKSGVTEIRNGARRWQVHRNDMSRSGDDGADLVAAFASDLPSWVALKRREALRRVMSMGRWLSRCVWPR